MKKLIVGLIFICCSSLSYAQVDTPEECILNTLKSGGASGDVGGMVRYSCTRNYIQQMESKAKQVNLSSIKSFSLKYLPANKLVSGESMLPKFEVQLKNDSSLTIIYALIHITNKNTKQQNIYRLFADEPIRSFTAGHLRGYAIPISNPDTFWLEHHWGFVYVFGVE